MKICNDHPERVTPLIYTFAFRGAEYWCPYCGYTSGIFGAGTNVVETDELMDTLTADTKNSAEYLEARSTREADSVEHEGKRIHPSDLPAEIHERHSAIINAWEYPFKR